jgi:RNA-binding protein 23/39
VDSRERRPRERDHEPSSSRGDEDLRRGKAAVEAPRPRKARTPTPERELREMQRMSCTIMAYGLSVTAAEYDVFEFFSQAGEVVDVRMIMDKHTQRHKGIAYIEYKDRSDFLNALQLNGKPLKGMPMNVKAAEAEKNFAWEAQELQKRQNRVAADSSSTIVEAGGPTVIKVENIPNLGLTEDDIKPVFEAFGNVQSLRFERDRAGEFTGVVYVQFPTAPEGRKAQLGLDSSTALGGPPLSISIVETASYVTNNAYPGELDEGDEAGGMRMNASARTALMGRMSGAAGIERPKDTAPLPPPPPMKPATVQVHVDAAVEVDKGVVGSASPRPTTCLLLKNMFSPEEEEGDDWPEEIGLDTRSECEKFGQVVHIYVDRNSRGFVYLKFADESAAVAAQKALHGRWYSHKQIIADFQFTQLYNRHFNLV